MLVRCCGFVEKEYMEKNYCNSQYFQGKKYKAKFAISLILKKIKSTKIILEKIIKKRKGKKPSSETL